MDFDPSDLVDPQRYAQRGYPHDVWTRLRADAPVAYVEAPGYQPFWAITKHADILHIAAQALRFSSAAGITLARDGAPPMPPSEILVLLDPPKHGPVRRLVSARFTPRAVRDKRDDVERLALDVLEEAEPAVASGACDFVERIAAPFPLAVIAWIIGVPGDDWELLFRWTNEIIGKDDPEYRREGESPGRTIKRARGELHAYSGRPDRPASARAAGRSRERDHRGEGERALAVARPARRVLRALRRSGQRDHAQRDQRRSARLLRAARGVGTTARATASSCPTRSRRSCAG